jgi:hypothetical protein
MPTVPFDPHTGYQWIKTKDFIRWHIDHRVLAIYYGEDMLYILVRADDEEGRR